MPITRSFTSSGQPQPDDSLLVDVSAPISGINNSLPPSLIDQDVAQDAKNRLSQLDGLNRPRPGITRLQQPNPTQSLDSIHHIGTGVFIVNNAASWYKYDNRSQVLSTLSGGPAYALGAQVYSALANTVLYFSSGSTLNKYDPAVGFGTVTLLSQYPTALYPIWALGRLIYVYKNTLVISDVLNPEYVDPVNGSVTLDPIASDTITGQALWQDQKIAVFRNGSTWLIETGPGLSVPNWSVNQISATVGNRCQGTIAQCEADLYFLSETGRGVYALSQAPASNQEGVWLPISLDVQGYIDRINWAAADNARATYWNRLYILSVPLDNSPSNNFMLIYSVPLKRWQGLWSFTIGANDVGARDLARDRTDVNYTVLLVITKDGIISRFTYPLEGQYYDKNLDSSAQTYDSWLLSRSFTFNEDIAQVRPHSARFQFLSSVDPVTVTAIADRGAELVRRNLATNSYLLSLTIPGFPFDLDIEGYKIQAVGLLKTGICTELQFKLEGTGNWSLFQIRASAFESMPLIAQ
jgi:hypothetical protein